MTNIYRLATPDDYIYFDYGPMRGYKVKWDDLMNPGSPCANPAEGVLLYNAHMIALANGQFKTCTQRFEESLAWCLSSESSSAYELASDILQYRMYRTPIPLIIRTTDTGDEIARHRHNIMIKKEAILTLPATKLMALRAQAGKVQQ